MVSTRNQSSLDAEPGRSIRPSNSLLRPDQYMDDTAQQHILHLTRSNLHGGSLLRTAQVNCKEVTRTADDADATSSGLLRQASKPNIITVHSYIH
ncbi:hypothetical protein BJX64DRAFT_174552 [Aspergillus heterothallicus]